MKKGKTKRMQKESTEELSRAKKDSLEWNVEGNQRVEMKAERVKGGTSSE